MKTYQRLSAVLQCLQEANISLSQAFLRSGWPILSTIKDQRLTVDFESDISCYRRRKIWWPGSALKTFVQQRPWHALDEQSVHCVALRSCFRLLIHQKSLVPPGHLWLWPTLSRQSKISNNCFFKKCLITGRGRRTGQLSRIWPSEIVGY